MEKKKNSRLNLEKSNVQWSTLSTILIPKDYKEVYI